MKTKHRKLKLNEKPRRGDTYLLKGPRRSIEGVPVTENGLFVRIGLPLTKAALKQFNVLRKLGKVAATQKP